MGNVGRPPKPIEEKRRQGNPGQRPLPDKGTVVALPPIQSEPPAHLSGAGLVLWSDLMSIAPWISVTDGKALVELCDLVCHRQEMSEAVKRDGLVLQSPNGAYQAHPLLAHIRDTSKQIHALMSLFGLTPSDRTRIGLGEVAAQSKLQAMMEKQKAKNANL